MAEKAFQVPVFMPWVDKYDHTAVWPEGVPLPSGISGGERRFEIETTGSGWNLIRKIKALAVRKAEGGVTVYGDRSLNSPRESGYVHEGRVSVEGKSYRAFTSSQLFLVNGKLVDMAILYVTGGAKAPTTAEENPIEIDEHAKNDLDLYIENTEPLYRMQQAILANLQRHAKKGHYDAAKAAQGWSYLIEAGAKSYAKEFGEARRWHELFPKPLRDELSRDYEKHFKKEVMAYAPNPAYAEHEVGLTAGETAIGVVAFVAFVTMIGIGINQAAKAARST